MAKIDYSKCPRCGGTFKKTSGFLRCEKCGHVSNLFRPGYDAYPDRRPRGFLGGQILPTTTGEERAEVVSKHPKGQRNAPLNIK